MYILLIYIDIGKYFKKNKIKIVLQVNSRSKHSKQSSKRKLWKNHVKKRHYKMRMIHS